jgi:hypothetical protein
LLCSLSGCGREIGTALSPEPQGVAMLVFDPDPKGANVRETPGGKVVKVIPAKGKTDAEIDLRRVIVAVRERDWFTVRLDDGSLGWVHCSMLGACVAPYADNANTPMHLKPEVGSALVTRIIKATPVWRLDVGGTWAKAAFYESSGNRVEGWMEGKGFSTEAYADLAPLQNAAVRLKAPVRKAPKRETRTKHRNPSSLLGECNHTHNKGCREISGSGGSYCRSDKKMGNCS